MRKEKLTYCACLLDQKVAKKNPTSAKPDKRITSDFYILRTLPSQIFSVES